MSLDRNALLARLDLQAQNAGACAGPQRWRGTGPTLTSRNPSDESLIAEIATATADDYDAVLESAVAAARAWREVPAPKRGEAVRRLGLLLRERKDALGTLIALENGKIKAEGDGEVQEMIDIADFAVGQARMLYGKTMHSERPGHRMYEQWHPLGVAGVITAFNFPVAVWSWNALLAAVCGGCVLWKPSEETPLTAIAVQKICRRVLDHHGWAGVFNLCVGTGPSIGESMAGDRRLPLISFTGSTRTGRHVATTVAQRQGRTILELGGNNGIIVMDDADPNLALAAIVFGSVGTAGQRCTTTRRLFLQSGIAGKLRDALIAAYKQVRIGDPLEESTLMGRLINERAVENMMQALRTIEEQGGKVIYGGHRLSGCFVEPTLVLSNPRMAIVREEIFAPILHIMEFERLEDAITWHNEVPQGLSSAIFTTNLIAAEAFLSQRGSDCGIANVNIGTSGAEIGGAFGGEKDTGGGREAGRDSWKAYMRRQTNTINWSSALPLAQGIKFSV